MKHLFASAIALLLSVSLLGCDKKSDDAKPTVADPFLGHWVAESRRVATYTSAGQVDHDNTTTGTYLLDATATTYTQSQYYGPNSTGTYAPGSPVAYTRAGEFLTVPGQASGASIQLRGLADTGFTYVQTTPRAGNGPEVATIVYHR